MDITAIGRPHTKTTDAKSFAPTVLTSKVTLSDGATTTVHIARYEKQYIKPKLKLFKKRVRLVEWCRGNGYNNAISGGYFLRNQGKILGETWLDGIKINTAPFGMGWSGRRGCVHIDSAGNLQVGPLNQLKVTSPKDLIEVGPTLLMNGVSLYDQSVDPEGFTETAYQHDEDIDCKRHPRAAIGVDENYIWTVAADGRTDSDAGLYLKELADVMKSLGAREAINLDGGSSTSLITCGSLVNRPRTTKFVEAHSSLLPTGHFYENERVYENTEGFPVYSAIVFS
jgi:hypothetical protein